jgi:aminoglycoside 6'-N-acetyltransferase I
LIGSVEIRRIAESDRAEWTRLRDALWPGAWSEHDRETRRHFETGAEVPIVFVAASGDRLVGFLELDYRKYAPGCSSSPVPFIEGWYVERDVRRHGVGRALVDAAEAHARASGHHEIASDVLLENTEGLAAHAAVGYEEVERVVCFRRALPSL